MERSAKVPSATSFNRLLLMLISLRYSFLKTPLATPAMSFWLRSRLIRLSIPMKVASVRRSILLSFRIRTWREESK